MKTTILFAALLFLGFFFQNSIQHINLDFDFSQNEKFFSFSALPTLKFHQGQKSELPKESITKQSSSFISQIIKVTILPIGSIVFLIWLLFGLDILRLVKKRKIKIIKT
jgi:hypothetical protein